MNKAWHAYKTLVNKVKASNKEETKVYAFDEITASLNEPKRIRIVNRLKTEQRK